MAITITRIEPARRKVIPIMMGVTQGAINRHWKDGRQLTYIITIRTAGAATPTEEEIINEGVILFEPENQTDQREIKSEPESAMDVYVYCSGGDEQVTDGVLVAWGYGS